MLLRKVTVVSQVRSMTSKHHAAPPRMPHQQNKTCRPGCLPPCNFTLPAFTDTPQRFSQKWCYPELQCIVRLWHVYTHAQTHRDTQSTQRQVVMASGHCQPQLTTTPIHIHTLTTKKKAMEKKPVNNKYTNWPIRLTFSLKMHTFFIFSHDFWGVSADRVCYSNGITVKPYLQSRFPLIFVQNTTDIVYLFIFQCKAG